MTLVCVTSICKVIILSASTFLKPIILCLLTSVLKPILLITGRFWVEASSINVEISYVHIFRSPYEGSPKLWLDNAEILYDDVFAVFDGQ